MLKIVDVREALGLEDYAAVAHLAPAVAALEREARTIAPLLEGRTIWMVNSTAEGGGVAEMLPKQVHILRELGISTQWAVIDGTREGFFDLTKRLHNLIHGVGDPHLSEKDREVYDAVSRDNAEELKAHMRPEDILVIHDPQPMGTGALVIRDLGVKSVWRCHIGLDEDIPQTRAAWDFLEAYSAPFERAIFTAPEYVPPYLADRSTILTPAIDPLAHKNRDLSAIKLMGVLCNASLAVAHQPVLTPPFSDPAQRLQPDGTFAPANVHGEIGMPFRPLVTQISRWDRLKGWRPLLHAFVELKKRLREAPDHEMDPRHRHRLEIVRLVLAGPDPSAIQDDPEGLEVFEELRTDYMALDPDFQKDIAILSLPMRSRKENHLMVNALQRCSSIVVQNSLREGFGLTATEAMWKHVPVLGTQAVGLRRQIRDGVDGRLVQDAGDVRAIARTLDEMLADPAARHEWGRTAQRRVHDEFLVFEQLRRWLEVLAASASGRAAA